MEDTNMSKTGLRLRAVIITEYCAAVLRSFNQMMTIMYIYFSLNKDLNKILNLENNKLEVKVKITATNYCAN